MNNLKMNRIMAYIIDIFIISLITTLLGYVNIINPSRDKYNEAYNKYTEYYETNFSNSTTEELTELITKDMSELIYKLSYYGKSYTITEIIVVIMYFTLFPYFFNGQTIGKKIMKIKLIDNEEKKPSLLTLFLRSLFIPTTASIIMYTALSNTIVVLCLFLFKNTAYMYATLFINLLATIYCYVDIIMMLASKEEPMALHDKIFKTKVIKC